MTGPHLVSIIIPCYNYGHLLQDALVSVQEQTYSNWECIIVDDGSKDNTAFVAQQFSTKDPRIKYIFQPNKGLASARNTGLKSAAGEFVQLLDADDLLLPNKIFIHLNYLIDNPEIDLVYSKVYCFDKELSTLPSAWKIQLKAQPKSGRGEQIINALLDDNMFLVHCALFKRSVVEEIGFFNEKMITCEDWNFWFRMAMANNTFHYLDADQANVYVRSHGINMSANRKNMWIGRIFFYREAKKMLAGADISAKIRKKNSALLALLETRYQLAFGSILRGVAQIPLTILISNRLFHVLYDSLYWIKERALKRL